MDYNKHVINVSETSSDENNQGNSSEKLKETSVGRTYDCNFCRRGFTNAQALGGHMNIHRKDKAKANPKTSTKSKSSPSSLNRSNTNDTEFLNSSNYFVPISIEQAQYYHAANYQLYYPVSSHSYPPQYSYIYPSDLNDNVASTENVKMEEEILEANLSLEIGSSHMEDSKGKSTSKADEIDLELRL